MECETADNYEPGLLTAEVMSIKQSKPECEPEETGAQIGRWHSETNWSTPVETATTAAAKQAPKQRNFVKSLSESCPKENLSHLFQFQFVLLLQAGKQQISD